MWGSGKISDLLKATDFLLKLCILSQMTISVGAFKAKETCRKAIYPSDQVSRWNCAGPVLYSIADYLDKLINCSVPQFLHLKIGDASTSKGLCDK